MSDTPKTDEAIIPNSDLSDWGHGDSPYVHVSFARQLERENNQLRQQLAEAVKKSELHEAVERAAKLLPEDGQIVEINIEAGSGWVVLYDGNGNHDKSFVNGTLAEQVNAAVDAAIEAQKGKV